MSEWYKPEGDDISIDKEHSTVDIYVKSDDWGAIYVSLSFEQIKDLYNQIMVEEEKRHEA